MTSRMKRRQAKSGKIGIGPTMIAAGTTVTWTNADTQDDTEGHRKVGREGQLGS